MALDDHSGHAIRGIETQTVSVWAEIVPQGEYYVFEGSDPRAETLMLVVNDTDQGMGHSDYRAWECLTCGITLDDAEINRLELDYS